MMEVDTKGWTQAEEALAEVVLWGSDWAMETPAMIEACCRYHACWNLVVLKVLPHSIEEKSCGLFQPPFVPTGPHCFQLFVPIVVLLLMMMSVWVKTPMAEDCPACNYYA